MGSTTNFLRYFTRDKLSEEVPDQEGSYPTGIHDKALSLFLKKLNEHRIRYIITGETATAFYGLVREFEKVEIWISPDVQDIEALISYLNEDKTMKYMMDNNKIGISRWRGALFPVSFFFNLFYFKTYDFNWCYTRARRNSFEGVDVNILHLDDLIIEKIASGRLHEKETIRELERIKRL